MLFKDNTPESLSNYFMCAFAIADDDQDGVLSTDEVATMLRTCGYEFGDADITRIVQEVDTNHDGVLQYPEFVQMILNVIGKVNIADGGFASSQVQ